MEWVNDDSLCEVEGQTRNDSSQSGDAPRDYGKESPDKGCHEDDEHRADLSSRTVTRALQRDKGKM